MKLLDLNLFLDMGTKTSSKLYQMTVALPPEKYRGVTYEIKDGASLEIADGHIAAKPEVFKETIISAKVSAMVKVDSVVPVINLYKDQIKFPVRKYYWGSIEVALRDPDGFVLVFIAPATDEEFKEVSELLKIETVNPQ